MCVIPELALPRYGVIPEVVVVSRDSRPRVGGRRGRRQIRKETRFSVFDFQQGHRVGSPWRTSDLAANEVQLLNAGMTAG